MKFRVIIGQDEDGVFIAQCSALPGCVSQGQTRKEAEANIKEAIQGYIKTSGTTTNRSRPRSPKRLSTSPYDAATRCFRTGSGQGLLRVGYMHDHRRGSHIILRQEIPPFRRLTMPDHKEIAKGTLRAILREAGITFEEFQELL